MRCYKQRFQRPGRAGVTWFEVVVTILILLLLFTLASKYTVQNAVPAARRAECQNKLHQIVMATLNRAQRRNNKLPHLTVESEIYQSNWFIELLSDLDKEPLHRAWVNSQRSGDTFQSPFLREAHCPADSDRFRKPGALSYVANSGFGYFSVDSESLAVTATKRHSPIEIDWNRDGSVSNLEQSAGLATGVFWPHGTTGDRTLTLDYITSGDGQSQTIVYTENKNAGAWTSSHLMDVAFVVGLQRIEFAGGNTPTDILARTNADLGPFAINGGQTPRRSPGPSSNHNGIVVFTMADGRTRCVNPRIDQLVYLRLMTPNGRRFGESSQGLKNY